METVSYPTKCHCGQILHPKHGCRNCDCRECGGECTGRDDDGRLYCVPCSRAAISFEQMAYGEDD